MLADAEALLTCYGVGEESGAELLHAVVELCFTSSVRFLQPGLLLKVGHIPSVSSPSSSRDVASNNGAFKMLSQQLCPQDVISIVMPSRCCPSSNAFEMLSHRIVPSR